MLLREHIPIICLLCLKDGNDDTVAHKTASAMSFRKI